jgi:hypothetical protein
MNQVVVNHRSISIRLDPYSSLKALASYSGLSVRKLRDCLNDPLRPLPYDRVGGKIVVRRSDFDAWIARYRMTGSADVNEIVNKVLARLLDTWVTLDLCYVYGKLSVLRPTRGMCRWA